MTLTVRPLHPLFAAELLGADLREAPAPELVEVVEQAMAQYAVLAIRDQHISDEDHIRFSRAFGPLELPPNLGMPSAKKRLRRELYDASNLDADGHVLTPDSPRRKYNRGTGLGASAVVERPPTAGPDAIPALLRHPAHTGGSDGIFVGAHPHPRGWGTFARFLGHHVRERGDWTWPQAAQHLAAHPARRFGLTDRGQLRPGLAADLAVVDPATVADRADYAHPTELAVGVDDVVVGGEPVLRGGELTGALAGRPLRPYPGS